MKKENNDKLPKRINKPWGYELLIALTDKYAGKILSIKKGKRLSLQYHKKKDETLYVLSGVIQSIINNDCKIMVIGEVIHLPPETKHRIEAISDATILEISTSELDDIIRLEDDYDRIEKQQEV